MRGGLTIGKRRLIRPLGQSSRNRTIWLAEEDGQLRVMRLEPIPQAKDQQARRFALMDRELDIYAALHDVEVIRKLIGVGYDETPDAGAPCGWFWTDFEYIDALTLRERIDLSPFAVLQGDELYALTAALHRALYEAHDRGVVHRDLKPENVLISRERPFKAWLIDFDVAYNPSESRETSLGAIGSPGSVRYMAPEQFSRRTVDHRADQYAAALVLWEAIAGELPGLLRGATASSRRRLDVDALPIIQYRLEDVVGVRSVLIEALQPKIRRRFRGVEDFFIAFREEADGQLWRTRGRQVKLCDWLEAQSGLRWDSVGDDPCLARSVDPRALSYREHAGPDISLSHDGTATTARASWILEVYLESDGAIDFYCQRRAPVLLTLEGDALNLKEYNERHRGRATKTKSPRWSYRENVHNVTRIVWRKWADPEVASAAWERISARPWPTP